MIFRLTYKQHGGSGTNLTLNDVLGLEWPRFVWWVEQLEEQRQAEKNALDAAYRAGSKR